MLLKSNLNDIPAGYSDGTGKHFSGLPERFFSLVNNLFLNRNRKRLTSGQSLVEIAILFPILLMLLSGLVEFGFLLNQYLNLLDGAREAARFVSDGDPFIRDTNLNCDPKLGQITIDFYRQASCLAQQVALPIKLDPSSDDVVISAFGVADGSVVARYPTTPNDPPTGTETPGEWHQYGYGSNCQPADANCNPSQFTNAEINTYLSGAAPNTGIVLVEIYYDYHQILALPWITAFVPDPIKVHTYAIMPLVAAEPLPPYP